MLSVIEYVKLILRTFIYYIDFVILTYLICFHVFVFINLILCIQLHDSNLIYLIL